MNSRAITIAIWVVLAFVAAGLEGLSRTDRRWTTSAGRIARVATRPLLGRVAVSLAWMWIGWHVFAR